MEKLEERILNLIKQLEEEKRLADKRAKQLYGLAVGGQIKFPASQNPSADPNTLDDYEEGTWTPTLGFGGNSVNMTYAIQNGYYTKVGHIVHVMGRITLTNKGTSTGIMQMRSLPFRCKNVSGYSVPLTINFTNVSFADFVWGDVRQNDYTTSIMEITNAGVVSWLDETNCANNTTLVFSGSYMTTN